MKIAFFETDKNEEKILRDGLKNHTLLFFKGILDNTNFSKIRGFDIISVETGSEVTEKIIKSIGNLKMIAARCTGYDKIDLAYCKKNNIIVSNVPTYSEHSVAEHTFALLLSISRNITKTYNRIHKNNFSIEGLEGFDLNEKTIGVIGTGHIGSHVIRIARGFEMKVLAFSRKRDKHLEARLGFKYVNLDKLLKKSDVITLHTPLTRETEHLIDKKAIKKMKTGVVIINTARGRIIDTPALVKALEDKKIYATGLDVLEGEELIKNKQAHKKLNVKSFRQLAMDHKLLNRENVIFTPHIAFSSRESRQKLLRETINNIKLFLKNKIINNVY
ncbi:hydroxyacid dehydrogenase [Candidatus Pacearchaeota archaeon]|nr:hydroxyacid dehydrogenase [Candidatus Pacearchaeota archaeon]